MLTSEPHANGSACSNGVILVATDAIGRGAGGGTGRVLVLKSDIAPVLTAAM
jgi:hypothetical protein